MANPITALISEINTMAANTIEIKGIYPQLSSGQSEMGTTAMVSNVSISVRNSRKIMQNTI